MSYRRRRTPFHAIPEQLSLPLDYSRSESGVLSQNPSRSIGKRARRRRGRLATSLATLEQRGIAHGLASSENDNIAQNNRQRQRFSLTTSLSTLITEENADR